MSKVMTIPMGLSTEPTAAPLRSWVAQIMLDTVGRSAARIGLVWVVFTAFLGVFAPFLANSYPLLAKVNGKWSSPMARHLTAADVTLMVAFVLAFVLLAMRRAAAGQRLLVFVGVVVVVGVIGLVVVRPPRTNIYEQYRELKLEGRLESAVAAPLPYSPGDRLRDSFEISHPHPWPPSWSHPLGTDRVGGDVLSQMIYASRLALSIGFISTGIAAILGTILGGLMGYFAGMVDLIGMRLAEIFSAIPTLYLLLLLVAFFERNIYLYMVVIGITSWVGYARFVRAEFLRLRQQDFVHAAVASGLRLRSVLFRHILPNALAPLLVNVSFGIASAILLETTLSFLGLGPADSPSWGGLLNQAVSPGGGFSWWIAAFPGLAIFLTVFGYNLIGESMRDAVDPRGKPH